MRLSNEWRAVLREAVPAIIGSLFLFFALVLVAAVATYEEPARNKDWCRDQFGTERPMEMCDD